MIFILKTTQDEIAARDIADLEDLFNRLIEADRRGRHFFVLSRDLVRWAIENLTFSQRNKSHLIGIGQDHAERGALPKNADTFLEIVLEDVGVLIGNAGQFQIGVTAFLDGDYDLTRSALVVEDAISDAGIYGVLFQNARKLTNVPNYNFEAVHGGGSRSHQVFDIEIEKKRITCCLLDTDKIAPCAAKSDTLRKVQRNEYRRNADVQSDSEPFVGKAFATVGHELENSISFEIAKELMPVEAETLEFLEGIINQNEVPNDKNCFWLFFDIKEGLDGSSLKNKRQNGQVTAETLTWILEKLDIDEANLQNLNIQGFGDGLTREFLNCSKAQKDFHSFTRSDYWRELFLPEFRHLLWFFASPKQSRV